MESATAHGGKQEEEVLFFCTKTVEEFFFSDLGRLFDVAAVAAATGVDVFVPSNNYLFMYFVYIYECGCQALGATVA